MSEARGGLLDGESLTGLNRVLKVKDLTALGIAAIVGAGIFSTIGAAAVKGGPGVSLLFIFTGIACAFSALCYAEFASIVPVSGSAYTYAYVAFGEIIAWIIGWDLLLEYAIGNVVVAISWSDYFTDIFNKIGGHYGLHVPEWMTMDYVSAYTGYKDVAASLAHGTAWGSISDIMQQKYLAWQSAPVIGDIRLICDAPAVIITILITWLVYIGIRDSKNVNNAMVAIKLCVVFLVIIVGYTYVNTDNWVPFLPNGFTGVMKGASAVFFAYIGFDAISTTSEECKDPKKDMPRGIIYSLIICTILYVLIALVLTGMVSYKTLGVGDPLSYVFTHKGVVWMTYVVGLSAIVAMASVLLVFQIGQPRIWMSMSRDGLMPKIFSKLHPKYNTPSFSTILTGFVVAIPTFFMNIDELTDLTSIGTLFAFVLVCGGILLMKNNPDVSERKFKVPYVSGRYIVPTLFIVVLIIIQVQNPTAWSDFFSVHKTTDWIDKLPMMVFIITAIVLTFYSVTRKLSLIPVLGLLSCFYLMTELGYTNWLRFVIWLVIGLVIYFSYSRRKSKLHTQPDITKTNETT